MINYEVKMSDGNIAEAGTLAAAMLAAWTMYNDSERSTFVTSVKRNGEHVIWATAACRVHVDEQDGGILTTADGSA